MKKMICAVTALVASIVTIVSLCSFTYRSDIDSNVCADASCQGKHCDYTVGCSCPGFAPIQHKEVYKLSYCKYCGHHRKYHK